jgi:hypothetical protein
MLESCQAGVGLRPQHYPYLLENKPKIACWFEAVSENYMDTEGRPIQVLEQIRRDFPIALHGVSMSIGSAWGLDQDYLKSLKTLVDRIDPFIVSDHLCWTGLPDQNLHDLLPLPFTEQMLELLLERVQRVQDLLQRPILLENVSSYLSYQQSQYEEWAFLTELSQRSDCKLLLDINNIYVSSQNHGFKALDYLEAIPKDCVGQVHLAGFTEASTHLFDTHSKPVHSEVWGLFDRFISNASNIPFMVEWDDEIPEFPRLEEELLKAVKLWSQHHAP